MARRADEEEARRASFFARKFSIVNSPFKIFKKELATLNVMVSMTFQTPRLVLAAWANGRENLLR